MQGPEESAANPTPETACIVGSLAVVDASLVAHSGAAGLAVAAGAGRGRPGAPVGALLNKATAKTYHAAGGHRYVLRWTPLLALLLLLRALIRIRNPQAAAASSKQQ
jgi:hypothetical protein